MKPHASDRSGLRNKTVFFTLVTGCFMLFSGHALALDVIDHFDGDSLNKTIWEASTKRGDGHLNQKQGHLEYTVMDPTAEDSFKWLLRARGPYNANWEAKIDLYNNTNPSQTEQVNSFGIDMYHCEDPNDWLYAELYASSYSGPPGFKGFHSEFATNDDVSAWLDTGALEGSSYLSGSVRITFDSSTKIISVSRAHMGSGWIPFGTFGVSGTGGGIDGNGNWSMTDTDQFCLKVYGYSEHMGVTGGTMYGDDFVATGMVPSRITLIDPNGGESVPAGEDYPITWEAPSDNVKFTLKYSADDDGFTWETIATGVTEKSYNWPVPVPKNNKRNCFVKVIGYNAGDVKMGADLSDAPFTIEVLKLDAPNGGGEPLVSQTQFPITWTTNPNVPSVDHVELFYRLSNKAPWKAIDATADPSDDGNFLWTVPKVASEKKNCKVKIVLKNASGKTIGSDVSDGVFTIQPAPLP